MKKLLQVLAVLLSAMLLLAAFGCRKNEEPSTEEPTQQTVTEPETEPETEAGLSDEEFADGAAEMVYEFYKPGKNNKLSSTLKLPSKTKFQGEDVEIVWEAAEGGEYVTIEGPEDGQYLVKINPDAVNGEKVVLKFTVTKGDASSSRTFEYELNIVSASDMDEILDRAYALQPGEAMDEEVTLVGVITKVNTAYDEGYKNVTVTIVVNGREDKPIMCYRLKGEGAESIKKNDTIKVKGIIKNYNGTIEFDAGCILEEIVEVGEAAPVKEYGSEAEIVDAAYALAPGDSMDDPQTLTGVITKVDTPYDASYGNVTVTMVVAGKTDKPIKCYRLKGEGADTIRKNDTIKVKGILKHYVDSKSGKSEIEFDTGCTLVEIVAVGDHTTQTFASEAAIVDALYALPPKESLEDEQTLTGVITKVDTPYDAGYQNVSVTIVVAGKTDKPVLCYRMKGDGADTIKKNDTIKVTGYLTHFVDSNSGKSKYEFTSGCKLVQIVAVGAADPVVNYGNDQQIVDAAYALPGGEALEGKQTLTGVISEVNTPYDAGYKNITVTIKVTGREDKPIQCFRMKGNADVAGMTDAVQTLAVGDTIKVTGQLKNYVKNDVSTIEFDANCTLDAVTKGAGNQGGNEQPQTEKINVGGVVPEAGKSYKMALAQQSLKKALYFKGTISDRGFLETQEAADGATVVTLEPVTGGVALSFTDSTGAKKYVTLTANGKDNSGHQKAKISLTDTATTVFEINSTYKTLTTKVDGTDMYLGTYNNYDTFSASEYSFLTAEGAYDVSQFPAQFILSTGSGSQGGNEGQGGETTETPEEIVDVSFFTKFFRVPLTVIVSPIASVWMPTTNASSP
ncbi:MAG: hypothetical protein J6Z38_06710, partial [Lachnospiraceae bacterium]|nr:hypothetical protein [Lachnospiraceae bacterium]